MTDKELRRLNKTELLWIIRDQEEEIEELKGRLNAPSREDGDMAASTLEAAAPVCDNTVSTRDEAAYDINELIAFCMASGEENRGGRAQHD